MTLTVALLVLILTLVGSLTEDGAAAKGGDGCIVYGESSAFSVSEPEGWTLKCDPPQELGVRAVLWPRNSNWRDARAIMYVNLRPKRDSKQTVEEAAEEELSEFKRRHGPSLVVKNGPPLRTADGRLAIVRILTGDRYGNYEAVAYVDSKTVFAVIVLSARDEKTYKTNYAAFQKLVSSYFYMDKGP